MSIEIEKKYRLTERDMAAVVASLEQRGAEFAGEDLEENIIYGGPSLTERNAVLRVRKIGDRAILTFKLRLDGNGDIRRHVEEETEVADPQAIQAIISELGYSPALVYEKRRRTWNFRSVEVVIDELPFGLYMEIEGSVTAIREAEMLLDLERLEPEPLTYPMLTRKLGTRSGDLVEARFAA